MRSAKNTEDFKAGLREALEDDFLRVALDRFALDYRANRAAVFADLNEKELIAELAEAKDKGLGRMDELFDRFRQEAEKRGSKVHRAADAAGANEIIRRIAEENGCKKIIKSKSMTAEETGLNQALENAGLEVTETDLGEWIIQLRGEGPSHMVMPAIHLSRRQVAETFSAATGRRQESDIGRLVEVARRELRAKFAEADMGISGANFAVAENGAIGLCSNEGNARLVSTLPPVHVVLCGLDKLVPSISDALRIIRVLPRNATAQNITAYVSWISGAVGCLGERKQSHIVFLDNGRSALAKDPACKEALRCVRCGACANVCPVYRMVGGHRMGHVYIGGIGLIYTWFFHGPEKARFLLQNCINCGACASVCSAGIRIPEIIQELRARLNEKEGSPASSRLLAKAMSSRKVFHSLLRLGKLAQKPFAGDTPYLRHLPEFFASGQNFRALPALAEKPFRDKWPGLRPEGTSGLKIGLFAGCAQDFIYPEQLEAALRIMRSKGCSVDFPPEQSCCGLPLRALGERETAEKLAVGNIMAFRRNFDYIVTLCASCASHMKRGYPEITAGDAGLRARAEDYAGRVIDFASFARDVLALGPEDFHPGGERACYHAPCHLCHGLAVTRQPRELIAAAGEYAPAPEEEVCCGFGGSYSVKFPEISARLMEKKLRYAEETGASTLVTDCPGCVLQLRGGGEKRGSKIKVEHLAEFLARRLK